ncbi:hypothetical protein [Hydrogenophaga sp.]|uniref:hypothetical protein n=1 Tax=Hydrogenophaga sp. TaxID=1904254 RepID=UPI00271770B6|nr:hypothetical protein [Hydrogenophaga sp.]MDO9606659.1 hypothetical protein [Hydrogenophaga sp.]
MSRQPVREMKRSLSAGFRPDADTGQRHLARDAALSLLESSIAFGHARLAVIRLSMAVHAGAEVPGPMWSYCEQAARHSQDRQLQALWQSAAERVQQRGLTGAALAEVH